LAGDEPAVAQGERLEQAALYVVGTAFDEHVLHARGPVRSLNLRLTGKLPGQEQLRLWSLLGCGGRTGRVHTRKGDAMIPAETQPDQDLVQGDRLAEPPLTVGGASQDRGSHPSLWRQVLARYERADRRRALLNLATSALPYLALSAAMYVALSISYLLALMLAIPTAVFLVRTFIVFHDCSHGSFLSSKRANAWLGTALGLLLFSPFVRWRHDHAIHHGTSGDLDRRGTGDIRTLTVAEYGELPWRGRIGYRLLRNPFVMFVLGPVIAMIIGPRIVARGARARMRRSVIGTNLALATLVGGLCWLIGWRAFLLIWAPAALLAGSIGIWLFYVQHQFEDAYWESGSDWRYADAALRGSSYLKLSRPLRFCTGNIGYHHVHHLSVRIPNYNLCRAHEENAIFHDVPTLSLWDGLRAVTLKLWDEQSHHMVTFAQARRAGAAASPARVPRRIAS
jgi:omega-6 fatty acid desaturase (delta-12 desaturase)